MFSFRRVPELPLAYPFADRLRHGAQHLAVGGGEAGLLMVWLLVAGST